MKCLLLLFIFCTISVSAYSPNELPKSIIQDLTKDEIESRLIDSLLLDYDNHIKALLHAHIYVESRGNRKAYKDTENAAGILQIRPVMIREVNKILKHQKSSFRYSLKDRWNSTKSIEIWTIVMQERNPTYNIRKSCLIWNGLGKDGKGNYKHYLKIKKAYELKKQNYNSVIRIDNSIFDAFN